MDIQKCNLISPEDEMKPFPEYLPYFVRVYLTDADDAVILGMNRENGVYWLSVTNIKEEETIRAVFDHVSALRPTGCTGLTAVLARTRYTAKQLQMSSHLTPQSADDIFSYYQRIEGSIYGQEKGGKYYEIQKYNLLEPKKPNYMPDPEDRLIQAYYGPDNDLILVGSADNNYIYWLSLTKADDTETNRQIVEWLTYCVPSDFGAAYLALRKTPYSYDQMISFYCAEITCFADISRALEKGTARSKTAGGDAELIQKLRSQIKTLSHFCNSPDPIKAYEKCKGKISRIQSRSYLRASENRTVRELYNQLDRICSDIYNAYMTEAR